ncbi:hypothetical protein EKO27_g9027 [Xylaria grammica]|uniref:Uncharacterized protein n=1 Tax=Xylaria grammica TaxID=363999 RepID=A0A439CV84_9PEZI|nr:hypothetical protein EKO27_g9027 [Xylaria grammica]
MELALLPNEIFCYLRNFLICYLLAKLFHIPCSWTVVSDSDQPHYNVCTSCDEEGCYREEDLERLPVAKFPNLDQNGKARIVAWDLGEEISTHHETIIDKSSPRNVVRDRWIKRGGKYSGILRIRSTFRTPDGGTISFWGTAFAINYFHAVTSAHLLWHPKLGPAIKAALYLDEREYRKDRRDRARACIAVVCHATAIKSLMLQEQRAETDFCIVSLAERFELGIRPLTLRNRPSPSCRENGMIIGFPHDMPFESPSHQLIDSQGIVSYHENNGVLSIEHMINTTKGNSGSPVMVGKLVVGVHHGSKKNPKRNAAAAINRNGNDVEKFSEVLKYMTNQSCQNQKLPEGIGEVGKLTGLTYPDQEIWCFA